MPQIGSVFVANRGEIAVRIIRACRKLGIRTVIGVSEPDRFSMPAFMCDRAVVIGPAVARESYLNSDALITAALQSKCQAIHPGYGFLSENADFARKCRRAGLIFIGPGSDSISQMGDKIFARNAAAAAGLPIVPGTGDVGSLEEAKSAASRIGFPLLLKAANGGGGRGIRLVRDRESLPDQYSLAATEAREAFGDDRLYIEKFVEVARHIEIQIAGDRYGNVIHLGERDCSSQRRRQKLIEEAPCPVLSESRRNEMCEVAVQLGKSLRFENLGTVEFIWDQQTDEYYFMEMNTRVQVEHPVTEEITGVDLVSLGIEIADGASLPLSQSDVTWHGHAIECRVVSEDPAADFTPTPGRLEIWKVPNGHDIRIDTHCYPGLTITPYYDSLLAKFITRGRNRDEAIATMKSALRAARIEGVRTNIPFHLWALSEDRFVRNEIDTNWVANEFRRGSRDESHRDY